MVGLLALLFLAVPIAELYVIVQVADGIGVGNTLVLLVAISAVGAWLAKRQGLGVLRRVQATTAAGRVPSRELLDGALIVFAAALMLTPGFLTDALALVLLLPPTRIGVRAVLLRRIRDRGRIFATTGTVFTVRHHDPHDGRDPHDNAVWDVESWEDPGRRDPPSLGQ